jgi:glutathione S-transferase
MIELYHHGSSVCAAKVRFTLMEKAIPWESRYVDILKGEQFDPEYLKLNPMAVVPTLVHDGEVLTESTVICEYLDDAFGDHPLKPETALETARMRLWTKAVDEHIHPACKYITYAA